MSHSQVYHNAIIVHPGALILSGPASSCWFIITPGCAHSRAVSIVSFNGMSSCCIVVDDMINVYPSDTIVE